MQTGFARGNRTSALVVLGCAALVVAGSLGPWATVGLFTVNGTAGDGTISLILAVVAGIAALAQAATATRRAALDWMAFLGLGLAAVVGAYDWANLQSLAGNMKGPYFLVQVGWGLPVLTFFGFAGAAIAMADILRWGSQSRGRKVGAVVLFGPVAVLAIVVNWLRGPLGDTDPSLVGRARRGGTRAVRSEAFCRQCGSALTPEDRFCGECGAPRPRLASLTSADASGTPSNPAVVRP